MTGRIRRALPALVGMTTVVVVATLGAGAASAWRDDEVRPVEKVVLFASDGMRPDLMEKYAKAGHMPTYKELMDRGATGKNGMLQAFPPNTGVGWYTMATGTYPSEHGSTNNTFHRTRRHVLEPDVVLGRRRSPGRHDRERRRTCRQEGCADRLGRRRSREHQRSDSRLHLVLLEPRRAGRRCERGRAGGLGILRRHLRGRNAARPRRRLDRRADRRPGGHAEADDVDDQLHASPLRIRIAPTTSTSTTA